MLSFTKMNGAGNDFVLVDNRDGSLHLDSAAVVRLCDRHRGVGADGVLIAERPEGADGADFRMRYYNADGGEAEMCGNGARCFARYVNRLSDRQDAVRFETPAGIISARCMGENVRLTMSEPRDLRLDQALSIGNETLTVHSVNTGVPHAVVFLEALETVDVARLGAGIRHHAHFAPKGTNANFVVSFEERAIAIRTFERGVEGETLACGTGVVAAAIVHHERTGARSPITVRVRGGDLLEVDFRKTDAGYREVTLTGPADFVFDGVITL